MAALLTNATANQTGTSVRFNKPTSVMVEGTYDGVYIVVEASNDNLDFRTVHMFSEFSKQWHDIDLRGAYYLRARTDQAGTSTDVTIDATQVATATTAIADGANLDAFSRLRVSNPVGVFDAQLTYDLQPTIIEPITDGTGAAIAHDATNRCATLTFSDTPATGKAYLQTYEHFRYQPIKSQLVAVTFNFISQAAGVTKFAGYSNHTNGIEFQNTGTVNRVAVLSDTESGDEIVNQSAWNLDKLDGTGPSGITLDITKTQIFIIDFQALYVGRVRVGFDIDGRIIYCHEFLHANVLAVPYIQTANLPIICGMIATATATTTMRYICSAVASEGGQEETAAFDFSQSAGVLAADGADTHLLTIRPKALFKTFENRVKIGAIGVSVLNAGTNSIQWKLVLGQALTAPTYANVNADYSSVEYNSAAALSGTPAIVINSGYVAGSNQARGDASATIDTRYPITLDAAGANRALGTLTLLVQGIGGTSQSYGNLKWREVR